MWGCDAIPFSSGGVFAVLRIVCWAMGLIAVECAPVAKIDATVFVDTYRSFWCFENYAI
jgi:hypothetical protein